MKSIVAGRIVISETEYVEAALGDFVPTAKDLKAFAEFVSDTYGPVSARNEVDVENTVYYGSLTSNVVSLPRGVARTTARARKGGRAA
ncbi:hypothetical protein [Streptomyces omiyaensis]|uniref:hypothetical protein n=1 Tax=Streptomyces omiyaensis TaxID=68247 RepID=UPI0036FD79FD